MPHTLGCQSGKLSLDALKNCVGAESVFELLGAGPAQEDLGGWEERGLGVRGHELQALPLMAHSMAWLVTTKAQEHHTLSLEWQEAGTQPEWGVGSRRGHHLCLGYPREV